MPLQDREQIQAMLNGMRRAATPAARVDSLKRLLPQLNYEAARTPLRPQRK